MYKHLIKYDKIRIALLRAINNSLDEDIHRRWLESRTSMLPKRKKPKYLEHRPIAVTVWSSKIICGFFREKIEDHLQNWAYTFEIQYGFTKGGKVEHCLYTLTYVTNRTYDSTKKRHKTLYFAMIDFKKAYDSVDRKKLIEVLAKYNINTKIIEMIVQMYAKEKQQ